MVIARTVNFDELLICPKNKAFSFDENFKKSSVDAGLSKLLKPDFADRPYGQAYGRSWRLDRPSDLRGLRSRLAAFDSSLHLYAGRVGLRPSRAAAAASSRLA